MTEPKTQRRWPRELVAREAELRMGDDLFVGTVLDASAGGAFFRPEAGVIDGLFTQLDEHGGWPGVGDTVTLHGGEHWQNVPATVCWDGCSETHRCRGLGLSTHA